MKSIFCACLDAYWRKSSSSSSSSTAGTKTTRRTTGSSERQLDTVKDGAGTAVDSANSGWKKGQGSSSTDNNDDTLELLNLLRPFLQDLLPKPTTTKAADDESSSSSKVVVSTTTATTTTTIIPVIRITRRNPLHINIVEWQKEQPSLSSSSNCDNNNNNNNNNNSDDDNDVEESTAAEAGKTTTPVDLSIGNARNILQHSHLPDSIQQRVIQTIARMEANCCVQNGDDDDCTDVNFLFHVASIFWLWNQLEIQSVTLAPIPCCPQNGISLQTLELLIGLPTNPNPINGNINSRGGGGNAVGLITPIAIALLKELLQSSDEEEEAKRDGVHKTANSRCCPPMTLISFGAGALINDSTGATASVRLLLGTPIAAAASAAPTPTTLNNVIAKPVVVRPQQGLSSPPSSPPSSSSSYPWKTDRLVHMEANLDDISAEALAFAVQVLLKNGAADAWVSPIVMKKGRAAHTIHCLCRQEQEAKAKAKEGEEGHTNSNSNSNSNKDIKATTEPPNKERDDGNKKKKKGKTAMWDSLLHLIFQHTTTLGVRINRNVERAALHRKFVKVQTPYSSTRTVDVKIGYLQNDDDDDNDDAIMSIKAEFDHCRDISLETGIPIQQIASHAVQEALGEQK